MSLERVVRRLIRRILVDDDGDDDDESTVVVVSKKTTTTTTTTTARASDDDDDDDDDDETGRARARVEAEMAREIEETVRASWSTTGTTTMMSASAASAASAARALDVVAAATRDARRNAKARRRTRRANDANERRAIETVSSREDDEWFERMTTRALETRRDGTTGRRRSRRERAREDAARAAVESRRRRTTTTTTRTTTTTTTRTTTHELDVEERYNASEARCARAGLGDVDQSMMIVRLLDDFEVTREDETTKTTRRAAFRESTFANPDERASIVVRGRLKAFGDDDDDDDDENENESERERESTTGKGLTPRVATACDDDVEIELRDVLECRCAFTCANVEARGFYVVTATAMYKLLRPNAAYAMLYERSFQMRYDLARRLARGLRRSPRATYDSVLGELLVRQPAEATALQRGTTDRDEDGETWTSYTERDVLSCRETLCNVCLREMVHLRRRSAQFVAVLTRKQCVDDAMRDARDEFVMCPHADVVHVSDEELMRIYGARERVTCADARQTIETGLEDVDGEEWTRRVSSASATYGADVSLIEEAITAWQFCATHADVLNAPVVAFDAFVRALMSPPSKMSWALFRDVHCALTAQIIPTAEIMRDIVIEVRSNEEDARVKRFSRYESPLHVHSWPDITRNLIESDAYKMDVKLAGFRASALLARVDYFQLNPRMRLATITALIAIVLRQSDFRKHVADARHEEEERRFPPSADRGETRLEALRRLETRCESSNGYAHLTHDTIRDHPTLIQVRSEMLRFLKISSDHWRRHAWMVDLVGALMRQCQTWTSFAELRLMTWNFEMTVNRLYLFRNKTWENFREKWRASLCAARTPAQFASTVSVLFSHLPRM